MPPSHIRLIAAFFSLAVAGCAGMLPGGSDSVNRGFYDTPQALKTYTDDLKPGMTKQEVFARLGRVESDFVVLSREEIVAALFGGRDAGLPDSFHAPEGHQAFLESLNGYQLNFINVNRKHGFTSPIRVRTDEKGYKYELTMVFQRGRLLQKPVLSGGFVESADSKTIFDYLNPGTVLNRAIR